MSHIFISYSRVDIAFAGKIVQALADNDLDTWIDWKSIPKGEDWEQEIYRGIEESDAFLFLISPDSVASQMCNKEIAHAIKNGKRILPIVIRDTDLKIIHPEISKRNWIFCRNGQDDFNKAIEETHKTIHTDFEWLKFHTRLQVKALEWERLKDASRLLRGKELLEADRQLAEAGSEKDLRPTALQQHYLLISRRIEEQRQRRIISGLGIALIIVATLGIFSWQQRNNAVSQRNAKETALVNEESARATAERSSQISFARQLGAQALSLSLDQGTTGTQSGLLAVEASKRFPELGTDIALRRYLGVAAHPVVSMMFNDQVTSTAFSPDGKLIVAGSHDGKVIVLDIATRQEIFHVQYDESVYSVAFSPNGKWVASGGKSGIVYVLDAFSGQEVARMYHSATRPVIGSFIPEIHSVVFSPNSRLIATSGFFYRTIHIWDAETGQEVSEMSSDEGILSVAFSPDGKLIASGSSDSTARVWDTYSGREITRMDHAWDVWSVAFSLDGKLVVSGSWDRTVRVWKAATGEEVTLLAHGIQDLIIAAALSPDSKWIVSGSDAGIVRVWNIATKQEVSRILHEGRVNSVAFDPSGEYVLSTSVDGTARVWNAATGQEVAVMFHDGGVNCAMFSPDGHRVASGGNDGQLQIWEPLNGHQAFRMNHEGDLVNGPYGSVFTIAVSQDGKWLVSGSQDGTARVWQVATGQEVNHTTYDQNVYSVAFSPNGKLVISGGADGIARVWDASTGQEVARKVHDDQVYSVAFSPDGNQVVSSDGNGGVFVWNAYTGQEIAQRHHERYVTAVAFSPDGKWVVSASWDKTAVVFEPITGTEVARMEHDDSVNSVVFSPNGKLVISGSDDGTARVWESATGREVSRITFASGVTSVIFASNGEMAAASDENTVRIWEAITGIEVSSLTSDSQINSLAFSPDGNYVIIGSEDGLVRLWATGTGQEVARMEHDEAVNTVTFSPDGKYIFSGSDDITVRAWLWRPEDLIAETCSRLARNFTRAEWTYYFPNETYQITCPNLPASSPVEIEATPSPTLAPTFTPSPTITIAPTSTSTLTANTPVTRSEDGMLMVFVPRGAFRMGSDILDDEKPVHSVDVDAFWMDQSEVTNAMYALCVQAGACRRLGEGNFEDSQYSDYPVAGVSRGDANAYCAWAGARLPTEAEWEKAARGGLEDKTYPWGDDEPVCTKGAVNGAQYIPCSGDAMPVKSFAPNGYGLYDMAGNVWEWVADWYGEDYYAHSPNENPLGPQSGQYGVTRGGSWHVPSDITDSFFLRIAFRLTTPVDEIDNTIGFRCARGTPLP